MLLAIDAGNTTVVFAVLDGTEVRARWRIATDARRTADEYAVWLFQLMQIEGIARDSVTDVAIATVVPRALHNLSVLAEKYFGHVALVAGQAPMDWSIALDVTEPRSVGADRVVNAIAAHERHKGDLIVIDFGTATTIDAIDYNGAYKGGIITPGVNLSLDALVAAAAKLPRIAIAKPENASVIGTDTESQMLVGVFWGYVAMMEGLVERMKREIGRPTTVIGTGGLAALFAEATNMFDAIEPDLTIAGLAMMHARVRAQ